MKGCADDAPSDLVTVGHVIDAWGLDGGVKIAPYSADASALLGTKQWWFDLRGVVRSFDVIAAKPHGAVITARLVGIADRDVAESLKGARIAISRTRFPATGDGEYYWVDLIGLDVVNGAGEPLGVVADLIDNGAHQIFVVREDLADGKTVQRLIPFAGDYVVAVELEARRIVVDWQKDY